MKCQGSKTLAFKWFHDWKKFQKIQPGRTYAQVLLLEKINQSHVKSGLKEYKLTTHPVTRKVTFNQHSKKFLKTKAHHTRLVKQQRNQVQVSNHGSSVTEVCKSSDTDGQVKLQNRFQVLQNTAVHESLDDQGFYNFRANVENKYAKVSKKPNAAPRVSDLKFLVRNEEIAKISVLKKIVHKNLLTQI